MPNHVLASAAKEGRKCEGWDAYITTFQSPHSVPRRRTAVMTLSELCLTGCTSACFAAAHAYEHGCAGSYDMHAAYSYYVQTARARTAHSLRGLGAYHAALLLYAQRIKMHATAYEHWMTMKQFLRDAVAAGVKEATFYLAAALEYSRENAAVLDGDAVALERLAASVQDRIEQDDADFKEAYRLYSDACEHGVAASCYHAGLMLYNGRGVAQDFAAAALAFQRELNAHNAAAARGPAAYYLAVLHWNAYNAQPVDVQLIMYFLQVAVSSEDARVPQQARVALDTLSAGEQEVASAAVHSMLSPMDGYAVVPDAFLATPAPS